MKYLRKYQASIVSIPFLFLTNIALWPGSDCDATFSPFRYLGLLAYFCFFLLSLVAWGALLSFRIQSEEKSTLLQLGIGSLWISACAGIALTLHAVGTGFQPFCLAFLFFGIVAAESLGIRLIPLNRFRKGASLSGYALAIFLLLRFAQASNPWSSTDPLFYHLLAPKTWLEEHSLRFIPNLPMLMQASYWEHLYLFLLQGIFWQPERGLIEFQIIAQWFHCVVGYIGSALLLRRLLKNFSGASSTWINIATIAAIFCADIYWTSQTAKNDWGICFWTFSGFLLLPIFREKKRWQASEQILAACFLGFAMGAKYSSAISILPVLGASTYFSSRSDGWKKSLLEHGKLVCLAVIPLSILFARNFSLTGDPLFPAFSEHFNNINISKTSLELFDVGFSGHERTLAASFTLFINNLLGFSLKTYAPLLLIPIFWKKKLGRFSLLAIAFLATLFIFSAANLSVMRYLGPSLPLCAALSVVVISLLPIEKYGTLTVQLFVFLLLIWRSDFFFTDHYGVDLVGDHPLDKAISDLWNTRNAVLEIRDHHLAGNSKAWLRENLRPEETVILSAENLSYYLPTGRAFAGFEDKPIDEAAREASSLLTLIPSLRKRNIRYILNTEQWVLAPRIALSILSTKAAREFPDSIVYRDKDSQILDLTILSNHAKP